MNTIGRQFSYHFAASSSGSSVALTSFNVPSGVYRVEVFATGGGTDASVSIDQASLYYISYNPNDNPVVFAYVEPDSSGVLSFHINATSNNASTTTGVILITRVDNI